MAESKENRNRELKKITIYDIAQESGVSAATVSRVLTNNANVRPEKKKKVEEVIAKYDFKPNALARGLADTRRKVLGIIVADIRNPFYADLFVACETAAEKAGYTLMLFNSFGKQPEEEKLLEKLVEQRVDGIIQIGGRTDDLISNEKYVEKVNRTTDGIPMVTTGKLDGTDCYHVRIDDLKAMDLVIEHLIGYGHKKIAMIGGLKEVLSTFDKVQRYKLLMQRYQIPLVNEFYNNYCSYDFEGGYSTMKKVLDSGKIPTAVIAINDFSAAGIQACISDHHMKIPEDISVVSFDNTYIAETARPKLTSIDYNYKLFGEMLVDTTIKLLNGENAERLRMVEPRLVIRNSCGPAKEK